MQFYTGHITLHRDYYSANDNSATKLHYGNCRILYIRNVYFDYLFFFWESSNFIEVQH